VVLDARPRRWRDRAAHFAYLRAVAAGDVARACLLAAADRGLAGLAATDLAHAGIDPETCGPALAALVQRGELEAAVAEPRWFAAGTRARVVDELTATLARLGRDRPDRPFVPQAELAAAVPGLPAAELGAALQRLVRDGILIERGGGFAAAGAGGVLSDEREALAARVGERLAATRFAPPTLASLEEELRVERKDLVTVLEVLTQRRQAVRVDKDLWFARPAVDEARERLLGALARLPEITLAQYRDELGAGRRHAQVLLELFDREGLTRRRGDVRVLRARR
jgi:selenocysteine-specific elongation factor